MSTSVSVAVLTTVTALVEITVTVLVVVMVVNGVGAKVVVEVAPTHEQALEDAEAPEQAEAYAGMLEGFTVICLGPVVTSEWRTSAAGSMLRARLSSKVMVVVAGIVITSMTLSVTVLTMVMVLMTVSVTVFVSKERE